MTDLSESINIEKIIGEFPRRPMLDQFIINNRIARIIQQSSSKLLNNILDSLNLSPEVKSLALPLLQMFGPEIIKQFVPELHHLSPILFGNEIPEYIQYNIKKYQQENESLCSSNTYSLNNSPNLFHDYKIINLNKNLIDNEYVRHVSNLDQQILEQIFSTEREVLCFQYSFAIPNITAIETIKKYVGSDLLFEIGAGSGYWAKLLNLIGVDIICFDDFSWDWENRYFPIHNTKTFDGKDFVNSKLFKNAKHLFICWPSLGEKFAFNYLSSFKGEYVYYCGEYRECCAEDSFFDLLNEKFEKVEVVKIPQWRGSHDYLTVFKRK